MYAWGAFETLRQYALSRRRLHLGLSHPLVVNRFLLWGIGTVAVIGIWVHTYANEVLGIVDAESDYLAVALLGGICAAAIWLAFYPPQAYRRHFEVAATGD